MIILFNASTLNWNNDIKVLWAKSKFIYETKFKNLVWIDPLPGGGFQIPVPVMRELEAFGKKAQLPEITRVAYDVSNPFNAVLALQVKYTDGIAVIYLYSNTRSVAVLATDFHKFLKLN